MFYINRGEPLTDEKLSKIVQSFKNNELPRLEKLRRYYVTKNDTVMNRSFTDSSKPNHKQAHAYAAYITDTLVAYMVGKAITYTAEDNVLNEKIQYINALNDEEDVSVQLAENQSIYGVAYELNYLDVNKDFRFKPIDTRECIPIYYNDLDQRLAYMVRYWTTKDDDTDVSYCTVYSETEVISCSVENDTIIQGVKEQHFFGDVPFNVFYNNNYNIGDFEPVISLIDAYDLAESDTMNNLAYFTDAYLVFKNTNLDDAAITDMKNNRIISIDGEPGQEISVDWLVKNANDTEVENFKTRTVSEIHKLSKVPNLDPSIFVSHTTASHIRYSLLSTEQLISKKEKKFNKGISGRMEKLVKILSIRSEGDYKATDIKRTFNRNIPQAIESLADALGKLRGLVSNRTLLGQVPFISDINGEIAQLEAEMPTVENYEGLPLETGEMFDTTTKEPKLNGAQITAMLTIIAQYSTGSLSREACINMIVSTLGVSMEDAESFVEVNTNVGTKKVEV